MADADGRIHTTFNQMIAATGRLSSTDPNLQNIPIRTETGRRIREGFVVGAGYETLLTADYSQIELRIMADLSGDEALVAAFESGHDFHAATASRVFGVDPHDVTPEQRAKIKAMNYGLAYGLSAFGLSNQLRISVEEARGLMDDYFKEFGGVRDYLQSIVAQARLDGYTSTIMGRRRYLPDLTSDNRQRREMAERMALNAPIQGSAADVIKVAMLRVAAALQVGGPEVADAAAGARRADLRGGAGRAGRSDRPGPRRDGRRDRPAGPAGGIHRHRPQLGRSRPLTAPSVSRSRGILCKRSPGICRRSSRIPGGVRGAPPDMPVFPLGPTSFPVRSNFAALARAGGLDKIALFCDQARPHGHRGVRGVVPPGEYCG